MLNIDHINQYYGGSHILRDVSLEAKPGEVTVVLGIDAAWTAAQPSGVALLRQRGRRWQCLALAPDYESFLAGTLDWSRRPAGGPPDPAALHAACVRIAKVNGDIDAGRDLHMPTLPIMDAHRDRDAVHADPVQRARGRRRFVGDIGQSGGTERLRHGGGKTMGAVIVATRPWAQPQRCVSRTCGTPRRKQHPPVGQRSRGIVARRVAAQSLPDHRSVDASRGSSFMRRRPAVQQFARPGACGGPRHRHSHRRISVSQRSS